MALTGPQKEQLVNAFLDAFPQSADLKYVFETRLSVDPEMIVSWGGSRRSCALELIKWVDSQGRLKELLFGAVMDNPKNSLLAQCGLDFGAITDRHTANLPPLKDFGESPPVPPRGVLFTHRDVRVEPLPSAYYREEIVIAAADAKSKGIYDPSLYGTASVETLSVERGMRKWPVRLLVNERLEAGRMLINQPFGERSGLLSLSLRSWFISEVKEVEPLKEIVFELTVEPGRIDDKIRSLHRRREDIFFQRPLLIEQNDSLNNLSFPVDEANYFNISAIKPPLADCKRGTLVLLDERATIQLLVSHNKSAVDMVILVDVSGSMSTRDYVGEDDRPHSRLDGVRAALETLIQRRLVSGSRVSRLAILAFGKNTGMVYPSHGRMEELGGSSAEKIAEIRDVLRRKLSQVGLRELKIDLAPTKISTALSDAADLFNRCHQEGTEKVLILLSDGADWDDKTDKLLYGEIVSSAEDPAALADSLYYVNKIRIHTVAISNEETYRRYCADQSESAIRGSIPNTPLLRKIAELADGIFFESPDARRLNRLFDELGQGVIYPLHTFG